MAGFSGSDRQRRKGERGKEMGAGGGGGGGGGIVPT